MSRFWYMTGHRWFKYPWHCVIVKINFKLQYILIEFFRWSMILGLERKEEVGP